MTAAHPIPIVAVIDRDRLTAYGLALLLRDSGYESVVGASAPEIFAQTEAAGRLLAAIVADDRGGEGAGGEGAGGEAGAGGCAEAAALLELARRAIPTIVLVSTADAGAAKRAATRGFASVPKPVEPQVLRELLRTLIAPQVL